MTERNEDSDSQKKKRQWKSKVPNPKAAFSLCVGDGGVSTLRVRSRGGDGELVVGGTGPDIPTAHGASVETALHSQICATTIT